MERLLDVGDEDAQSDGVEFHDEIGDSFGFAFAQQLLFAEFVETQQIADTDEQFAVEGHHCAGDVVDGRLVEKLELFPVFAGNEIDVQVTAGALTRLQLVVFGCADDEKFEIAAGSEATERSRQGGLVLLVLDRLQSTTRDGILWRRRGQGVNDRKSRKGMKRKGMMKELKGRG